MASGAVFPVYLNLFADLRGVDPKLVEAAGCSAWGGWR